MKHLLFSLFLFFGLTSFSQMNIEQLLTQVQQLKLPFDTPAWLPVDGWEGDIEFNNYSFPKNEITELYSKSKNNPIAQDKYFAAGYLPLGEATALVYLWSHVDELDSVRRYSVCMDTYDAKGLLVDFTALSSLRISSELLGTPENTAFTQSIYHTINGKISLDKGIYYCKITTDEKLIHSTEKELLGDYYTEDEQITQSTQIHLSVILPNGHLNPVYNEETDN